MSKSKRKLSSATPAYFLRRLPVKYVVPATHKVTTLAAWLVLIVFNSSIVKANPEGAQVAHGQVGFSRPDPKTLNINSSSNAILNWQRFSIDKSETTRFILPDTKSAILNRVTGQDPSTILGQLSSNGRVFLINPNGMVFGPNAVIDTASFVASTLNTTDRDFLAGKLSFDGRADAGSIKNYGLIQARNDGGVYLIAPSIENSGVIRTETGNLLLAAGQKLTISSLDVDHISFEVQAPQSEVLNLGKLLTGGGAMGVFASSIRNHGVIEASSATVDRQGIIKLMAQGDINIETSSLVSSEGPRGGNIRIESQAGNTSVAGRIETLGREGPGGEVHILGKSIYLRDTARVDVSGERGGGVALIGRDYQGQGNAKSSEVVHIERSATIKADAIRNGDGGRVIVAADDASIYGTLTARGGAISGDGGFIETSGSKSLKLSTTPDASALRGKSGTWLIDPTNISIVPHGELSTNEVDITNINAALNAGTNVAIATPNSGPDDGNIFLLAPVVKTAGGDATLTLQATNHIDLRNSVTSSSNRLNLVLDADSDRNGAGAVRIGREIFTNGGNVTVHGANNSGAFSNGIGVTTLATIDSAGGNIMIDGRSTSAQGIPPASGFDRGISVQGAIISRGGQITLTASNIEQAGITTFEPIDSGGGHIAMTVTSATNNQLSIQNSMSAGTGNISLTADQIAFFGNVSGTGSLTLEPFTPGRNIVVGGQTPGNSLNLWNQYLQFIGGSFSDVTIGHPNGTGTLTIDSAGVTINNNLTLQAPGTGGTVIASGPIRTHGHDLSLIAGDKISVRSPMTTEGGNINLRGANIDASSAISITSGGDVIIDSLGQLTLAAPIQTDAGSIRLRGANVDVGPISLRAGGALSTLSLTSTGNQISVQGSTLMADNLALNGSVAGTGSLTLLPATTGKAIDIGLANDPLLSSDNISMLKTFSGTLSIGGSVAPAQVRAGHINVSSNFRTPGDLTLVSLSDISVAPGASLGSGGTLTLVALGQNGTQGNITNPANPDRFFFDAPTTIFFANNQAGTPENPLTVRSGPHTVNVGAGVGVAVFDGLPGSIEPSSAPIKGIFDSFQAIGFSLNPNILNTRVDVASLVHDQTLPPEFFPGTWTSFTAQGTSNVTDRWNEVVDYNGRFAEWGENGPQTRFDLTTSVIDTFMPQSSWIRLAITVPDAGDITVSVTNPVTGRLMQNIVYPILQPGDQVLELHLDIQDFSTIREADFRTGGSAFDPSMGPGRLVGGPIPLPTTPMSDHLPSPGRDGQLEPSRRATPPPEIDAAGGSGGPPNEVQDGMPVPAQIQIQAKDQQGKPIEHDMRSASITKANAKALPPGAPLIDPVEFGKPQAIQLDKNEATQYRFFSLFKFDRTQASIVRTSDNSEVYSENRRGVRANEWSESHWTGKTLQGLASIGTHKLQVKAWDKKDQIQTIVWSDGRVSVSK